MDYLPKTEPREHQHAEFLKTRDLKTYAHFWEMGTGKSKLICDVAAYNYNGGRINALVVIAPNGVHRNWVTDEFPKHLPDYTHPMYAYWSATPKAAERKAWEKMYTPSYHGLRCFVFNAEGLVPTGRSTKELARVLGLFDCLLVVDESQMIKTPGAKRTQTIVRLGQRAKARRILTGTWTGGSPLDAYSQFKFLDPVILGFQTYTAFRNHYAFVEQRRVNNNRGFYNHVTGYRNMDDLAKRMAPYCTILYKKECVDLPDKVYETIPVELTSEQRRIYNDLRDDGITRIVQQVPALAGTAKEDPDALLISLFEEKMDEGRLSVELPVTLLLRLQQVLGGWVPDDDGNVHAVKSNRLQALASVLDGIQGKVIIWARFTKEVDDICALLGDAAVRYDGMVSQGDRQQALTRFRGDDACRYFVGKTKAGGRGLTLTEASFMVYYSQEFSREQRRQSEDRAHRIGQRNKVTYVDLCSPGTVDDKITRSLLDKEKVATQIEELVRGQI